MAIRVILAEDHQMFRQAVRMALTKDNKDDIEVVGDAGTGLEAIELVKELAPDICIMDASMPRMNGFQATTQISAKYPDTAVIILSQYKEQTRIARGLCAGAKGYILKEDALEELVSAIHTVQKGFPYLSPKILPPILEGYLAWLEEHDSCPLERLTPREREVLQMVAEGMNTQEIAHELKVTARTVESHRQHIMDKLNLHSIAELTQFAVLYGVVQPADQS
ncbi:MAG: response regulator transcription factor [Anaerolineales bacterium]|nr:response regulator transcription factor [Anaerolineales bacterium]